MENTVKVVIWLSKLANELKNGLEDGQLKWIEILGLSDNLMELKSVAPAIKKMYAELKESEIKDQQQVLEAVKAELNVGNDQAEEIVVSSINLGMALIKLIEAIKK